MWITNQFVDKPCRVICSFYLVLVICGVISALARYMVPSLGGGGGSRDFAIVDDPIQIDKDLFDLAQEYFTETGGEQIAPL